jgi:hypothetical protein
MQSIASSSSSGSSPSETHALLQGPKLSSNADKSVSGPNTPSHIHSSNNSNNNTFSSVELLTSTNNRPPVIFNKLLSGPTS